MLKINTGLIVLATLALNQAAHTQTPGGPPPGGPPPSGPPPGGPPPGGPGAPEANPPSIDAFNFTGETRFTETQLRAVLKQHVGDKVSRPGVKSDLDAITALYQQPGGTPATVSPNITHPAPGHVVVTYIVKEGK